MLASRSAGSSLARTASIHFWQNSASVIVDGNSDPPA